MRLRSALLGATILAMPIAASAQPVTGLYVGGGVGVNITQKEDINRLGVPALAGLGTGTILSTGSGQLSGSTGFAGVMSLGWGFGNGLRAEVEGNYRNNKSNGLNASNTAVFGTLAANVNAATTEQKYGGMVNVLYDFNGVWPWVVPYIGAGVGYQAINEKWNLYNTRTFTTGATALLPAATFLPGSVTANGHSTEGSFAYQAILGAAFPLPKIVPGLAATLEYRFLGTSGNRSYTGIATAVPVAPAVARQSAAGINFGPSYNHSILVGLRYNFGVAPPPPPPPAQPPVAQPARSYLVFFDWDKATLTDRARQIIREAADNSTKVQYTRIEVNGYTDTSGTPQYNMGLSIRRAKSVQAELIKDGVPANAITIQGFGETHLLVPTGPGVREPQNRRVEIIIR
jgi:outer membrane protein OmpA-like peptidoglycan-associated protein